VVQIAEQPTTGSLLAARYGFPATSLSNGQVLVAEGNATWRSGTGAWSLSLGGFDDAGAAVDGDLLAGV
jgi:hypothetical protein